MRATLYYTWVQPNYFETLGIPLSRGRSFRALSAQADHDAILSESAAHRLWPGQNPIGRTLRLGTDGQFHNRGELLPDGPTWQVIGVARDTRGVTLDGSDSQQVYLPLPGDRLQDYPMLVRTNSDSRLLIGAVEPAIAAVDPGLTDTASTLQAMLRRTDAFLAASFSAAIASSISLFGLLLASMGIYSTVSYDVVLRTREVGIRMAIGARKRNVLALMLLGSLRPVVFGLMSGTVLALGASRLLRGVLYGLSAIDTVFSPVHRCCSWLLRWPPAGCRPDGRCASIHSWHSEISSVTLTRSASRLRDGHVPRATRESPPQAHRPPRADTSRLPPFHHPSARARRGARVPRASRRRRAAGR